MIRNDPEPSGEGVMLAFQEWQELGLSATPLLPAEIAGVRVHLKCENLQPIGAFKIRGAWWALSHVDGENVVAVSSGNHAQGVAWAAREMGKRATIVMPSDAPRVKLDNTRALGAEIVLYNRPGEDRDEVAARVIEQRGGTLVHAFGDPRVIEGQGTAGLEAQAQLRSRTGRRPSRFIVCCGGGGLAAGLALACPNTAIHVVEPEGWDMVGQAIARGEIVHASPDAPATICDALQPTATKPVNLAVLHGRAEPGVTVTDDEVRAAQRWAFSNLRLVVEPGGAAALAAALAGKVPLDEDTVIMLTGGNADPDRFARMLAS